ncbi:hypothetical protein L1987_05124 [Smallanthus sonchifolius]|uniref:Uncharacterized protein n=1 Tax=Smallanthus sonchifolius TaxID=185202 RepID=A0ACB9JUT9_9ASTR|nr:hypothetical protein L1987_05124 [Smallanthus sonchifolius]
MEKETQNLKASHKHQVWDCESSLYDSFELKSFQQQLESAISAKTMSMPHLSSSSSLRREPPPLQPCDHNPTSKKHSKLTRSFNKLLRSVFRPRHTSTKEGRETMPEFDFLSPDMKSLVTRTRSHRFMPTSLGISCA